MFFRVEILAPLVTGFVFFDGDTVRVGEGIVANAGHLPRDLHVGLAGSAPQTTYSFDGLRGDVIAIDLTVTPAASTRC